MPNPLLLLAIATGLPVIFGEGIIGTQANSVVLVNATGLKIIRVIISDRTYEDLATKADKVLVSVTPRKHNMELIFRGGTHIDWRNFDFSGVHEITFELSGSRVSAHPK